MKTFQHPDDFRSLDSADFSPRVIVPTMGALHEGHLALITRARQLAGESGCVIVSIFVNPTQFDRTDDLVNYPRTMECDLALCEEHGVDVVYAPSPEAMYLSGHSITVTEVSLSKQLCGATRPGHFDGVCTVVLKLFNLTKSDISVFGKKDFQQLAVIRRMARDLNVPTIVEGVETVREESGLALSSRNLRLSPAEKHDAARIRASLVAARDACDAGETCAEKLLTISKDGIESSEQGARIDYLELLDADTLSPVENIATPCVLATAVFYGKVRLIDNIELG
ncbi:MAG: pantoate--beta-alanine ligase [Akkermansiaceae bacterium]